MNDPVLSFYTKNALFCSEQRAVSAFYRVECKGTLLIMHIGFSFELYLSFLYKVEPVEIMRLCVWCGYRWKLKLETSE